MAAGRAPVLLITRNLSWGKRRWRAAGLTHDTLNLHLGGQLSKDTVEALLPLWCWRTRSPTALNALTRLLVLGQTVTLSWASQALPDLQEWIDRGFFLKSGLRIKPRLALSFAGPFEVLSDPQPGVAAEASAHVMGATNATMTLQRCLLPGKRRHSLDLGTGSGLLALELARQSDLVWATDVNARALSFAALNAKLAGIKNIRFRSANMFEGLPPRSFDWIVGNLPFVVSPENRFIYRDAGLPGDDFCATVAANAGAYLAAGGLAQFLVQWTHQGNEPRQAQHAHHEEEHHLASWVHGNGCNMLVLRFSAQRVEDYALQWSQAPFAGGAQNATSRFARWMKFYAQHNIAAISTGMILLQKSSGGRQWLAIRDWPTPETACGLQIKEYLQSL